MTAQRGARKLTVSQKPIQPEDPIPLTFYDRFVKKLEYCAHPLSLVKSNKHNLVERTSYLSDIIESLMEEDLTEDLIIPNLGIVFSIVETNLFRPLPKLSSKQVSETTTKTVSEPSTDPDWPQVYPIYRILAKMIESPALDMEVLTNWVSEQFLNNFLALFFSENEEERDWLFKILNQIYLKFQTRRKFLRKRMMDIIDDVIHEGNHLRGLKEILNVLNGIVSGFSVPLKPENIRIFRERIIGLHKSPTYQSFSIELTEIVKSFLGKDPNLVNELFKKMIVFWPFSNSNKQVAFLQEMMTCISIIPQLSLEPGTVVLLIKKLAECLKSPHFKVCDYALNCFEKPDFMSLVDSSPEVTFPILIPAIERQKEELWHETLRYSMTGLVLVLKGKNQDLYMKSIPRSTTGSEYREMKVREFREKVWSELEMRAKKLAPGLGYCNEPYRTDHIVGMHNGLDNTNNHYPDLEE